MQRHVKNRLKKSSKLFYYKPNVDRKQRLRYCIDMAPQASKEPLTPYLKCLKEIITSEIIHVDGLLILTDKYLNPLSLVLSDADHRCIFINFVELKKLHYNFQCQLSNAADKNFARGCCTRPQPKASSSFANIFLDFKDRFIQHYTFYMCSIEDASAKLKQLTESDQKFQANLLECESSEDSLPALKELLIYPMQRITKYHLLLEKLADLGTKQCEEAESLEKIVLAQKAMQDVVGYLDAVKRDNENIQKTKKISFTPLTSPAHRFAMQCATTAVLPFEMSDYGKLLDDRMVRFAWDYDHKLKPAHLFLFENAVLICDRECNGVYNFKHACHLGDYKAEDWKEGMTAETNKSYFKLCVAPDSESVASSERLFRLINKDNAITICCTNDSTESSKRDWKELINTARDKFFLERAEIPTNHNFHTQTFDQPTDCFVCGKLLKGLICQGYKCSLCKRTVHKTCADNLYDCVQMRSRFQELKSFHERKIILSRQSNTISCKLETDIEVAIDTAITFPE